jgi:hypothetical protein
MKNSRMKMEYFIPSAWRSLSASAQLGQPKMPLGM